MYADMKYERMTANNIRYLSIKCFTSLYMVTLIKKKIMWMLNVYRLISMHINTCTFHIYRIKRLLHSAKYIIYKVKMQTLTEFYLSKRADLQLFFNV
jgi:hypothetical protein